MLTQRVPRTALKQLLLPALLTALLVFLLPAGVGQATHRCTGGTGMPDTTNMYQSWTALACHFEGHAADGGDVGGGQSPWAPGKCHEKYIKHGYQYPGFTEQDFCLKAYQIVEATDPQGYNYCLRFNLDGSTSEIYWDPVTESIVFVQAGLITNMFIPDPPPRRGYYDDECSTRPGTTG